MSFASPIALWALLLVPVAVAGYVWLERRRVREVARSSSPGCCRTSSTTSRAWRRHLPAAILLLAVATFLLGFARPHATLSERSEEATVVLAIDTSHSMAATDVAPTRLAAAQASARRFLAGLPEKYRVAVVDFSTLAQLAAAPTTDRAFVDAALAAFRIGRGHRARRRARDRGRGRARHAAGRQAAAGQKPPPAAILILSDGAQDGGRIKLRDAIAQAREGQDPRLHRAASGPPAGVVEVPHVGGYVERIQVPPDPGRAARASRRRPAAASSWRRPRPTSELVYKDLKSRLGTTRKDEEITVAFAGAGALLLLASGAPLRALVQEGAVIRARRPRRRAGVALARRTSPPAQRRRRVQAASRSASPSPARGS